MKDRLDYSLSDKELFDVLGGTANVLTYPELDEFENIDDVLGLNRRCILLYLTDKYYGHFTCMWVRKHKGNDILCFFDSYGFKPNQQFKFIDDPNNILNQEFGTLIDMIKEGPYEQIDYNDKPYQAMFTEDGDTVATCGKHCALRLYLADSDNKEYDKILKKYIKKHKSVNTYDDVVNEVISPLLK